MDSREMASFRHCEEARRADEAISTLSFPRKWESIGLFPLRECEDVASVFI